MQAVNFAHCLCIVFVIGLSMVLSFFFWGGGLSLVWISMGRIFLGEINFWGNEYSWENVTLGGGGQKYYTKFFLVVLNSLCPIFYEGVFRGKYPWGFFPHVLFSGK